MQQLDNDWSGESIIHPETERKMAEHLLEASNNLAERIAQHDPARPYPFEDIRTGAMRDAKGRTTAVDLELYAHQRPDVPDEKDFNEPYTTVLIDFAEIYSTIIDNIHHFPECAGDEFEYAVELTASLLSDYVLINEQSDWPRESQQYYRTLVRPEDEPLIARLMDRVEAIMLEYMPEFMSVSNQGEREKIQYAHMKHPKSTTWQFYMPESTFRRLCSKHL